MTTPRLGRRTGLMTLAVLAAVPAIAGAEPESEPSSEAMRLYELALRQNEERRYTEAVATLNQALDLLPESEPNEEQRLHFVLVILYVLESIYEGSVDEAKSAQECREASSVREARATVQRYTAEYRRAYGADARVSSDLEQQMSSFESRVDRCARSFDVSMGPCLSVRSGGCNRGGLAVALLAPAAVIERSSSRRDVLRKVVSALPPDVVSRLEAQVDAGEASDSE